jgi:hypothetical protein
MSANTGRPATRSTAFAVEENVKDGHTTSCPGLTPSASSASSMAWVHEVVSSTRPPPSSSDSLASTRRQKGPSPETRP